MGLSGGLADNGGLPLAATQQRAALTARGLIAEPFPVADIQAGTAIGTQRVEAALVGLLGGQVVSQIVVVLTTAGVGTVPTAIKLGLLDTSGNVLASTANVNADSKWTGAVQPIGFNLSASYTVPATGGYYAAIYQNGAFAGTPMQIGRLSGSTLGAAAVAFGSGARPFAEATSVADLTGTIALGSPGAGNLEYVAVA